MKGASSVANLELNLDIELLEALELESTRAGFGSPSEFIVFFLRQLLSDSGEHPTEEEETETVERLRQLGYIE